MGGKEFSVYILISEQKQGWAYVGCTSNVEDRLKLHNLGKTKSTKGYRPLKIIHVESYSTFAEARERKLFLKTGFGREEKRKIVAAYYSEIV